MEFLRYSQVFTVPDEKVSSADQALNLRRSEEPALETDVRQTSRQLTAVGLEGTLTLRDLLNGKEVISDGNFAED